jgi:streptomycin 6-kinase
MREFTEELLAGDALPLGLERARFLAHHTGLDEQAIWEWGYVERVSTGLLCLHEGDLVNGPAFLAVADGGPKHRDVRRVRAPSGCSSR